MAAILLLMFNQITLPEVADAIVPKQEDGSLESLAFASEILQASPQSEALDDARMTSAAAIAGTWESFRVEHGGWSAMIDQRTGKVESAEGEGIPFVPGRGNQLRMADISADLGDDRDIDLAQMEVITRAFLPRVANLLGVDPSTLVLNRGRSGHPAEYLWFVDFDVTRDGMPIEGARVVFRVNNGNLVQFGSENLPAEGAAVPKMKVTRNQALTILADYIGGFSAADAFTDGGSQHLVPVKLADIRFAEGFERGKGRGLARAWQFVFRRNGNHGTWRARIDATSGKMLELRDLNDYASAQVAGGVTSLTGAQTRPMPFADVSSGGYTNSAGVYDYTGSTVISALNGQYVKIIDSCGAISLASGSSGNLAFGSSSGTDCETPGYGGAGNTNASRTQFYHLNRAKEIARGWLNLPWLTSQLTAYVNLDGICNSFWDGASINFIRRGTGCSNAGQIQGVGLHEFGHGLDTNDGNGPSPDKGTGETYADWTAALITHDSCIGSGYLTSNCDGYGDACTSCTGVRDIDYTKHSSSTPHTVGNFTQVHCPVNNPYNGPCGREGHCESQVSSEALWDLTIRDLPNLGLSTDAAWALMERLWYLSRPTATAAFTCFKATSPWSSDGCGTGSLWKTLRAVDDDDGNLSNGTPHSAALYAAFDRHGIACASDVGASTTFRGCSQQSTTPNLSLAAGDNQVALSWSDSSGVYDVYRNEQGCNAGGFIKIANDLTTAQFIDNSVANDFTYFYKVIAQAGSNEACPLAPSICLEAAPCSPPAPPSSLTATAASANQINLSWTTSSVATRYHIYRATSLNGPYTQIGARSGTTFSDTGLSCNTTYYYVVRAAKNETCESGNSIRVSAKTTTGGVCSLSVMSNGGGTVTSWPAGINCGADCNELYPYNTSVSLRALPMSGHTFVGWSGACSPQDRFSSYCDLSMTGAQSATAMFSPGTFHLLQVARAASFPPIGSVTVTPPGINSTNSDSSWGYLYEGYHPDGASVTLTANASGNYVFEGWEGACTGMDKTCTLTLASSKQVWAKFNAYIVAVNPEGGTGKGRITSTPAGIDCGRDSWGWILLYSNCSAVFLPGTAVTLMAAPSVGSMFTGWNGGGCTGTGPCAFTVSSQYRSVAAMFSLPTHPLTVNLNGSGSGAVTSTPNGINCETTCGADFPPDTLVTLAATPAPGSRFDGWNGECFGTGSCTVVMPPPPGSNYLVTAGFSLESYSLAASLAGTGNGTVTSTPAGVNCGTDCNETYNYNTQVTLTATPMTGFVFSGWSGACAGTGTCTVAMTQARSVTATFSVATHSLTTSLAGVGKGEVTSTPAGISCGVDCGEVYNHNTQVTLTATPTLGAVFSGWSGACVGAGTCVVTMTQPRSVTATFLDATHALTTSLTGAGSGTVTSTPSGINCGTDCGEAYDYNTQVTLTATPTTGSVFSGWSGACTGTGTCTVTMTQARSVTAAFAVATHLLTTSSAGAGSGTVTSTPAGISCGVDCSEVYNHNTQVTLTATPTIGSVFSGWVGACTGTGTCVVTMTQAQSVTASFSVSSFLLQVMHFWANDNGTVTSTPAGIDCGADCQELYPYNTQVTLTPTPTAGSGVVFSGWSGECAGTGTCTVTMTQDRSVTATFSMSIHSLTTSLAGTGSGTVTSNPYGISCGVDCSEAYSHNTQVTLTAAPTTGSVFSGWSGACTGTSACTVTMTQARSVTATFSIATHALTASRTGTGSGTVTSTPAGINCGTDCNETYNYNTQVTLTATPSSALFIFKGWSGACTGTGSCVVTMDQAKSVTATFDDKGQDFYTVTPCRVYDTRVIGSPMTSEIPRVIQIAGACSVPVTAKAVSLNVTAVAAPGQGFITLYPGDISSPGTWTLSFRPLLNQANNAVIPLAWNGAGTMAALTVISGGGSMDMVVDVNGYYE